MKGFNNFTYLGKTITIVIYMYYNNINIIYKGDF